MLLRRADAIRYCFSCAADAAAYAALLATLAAAAPPLRFRFRFSLRLLPIFFS